MRRSKNYDEFFSEQLHDKDFAREYLLQTMKEDGLTLVETLKQMIQRMGITEFASLVGNQRANISRFVTTDEHPRMETLNRYLAPFNLQVKLDIEDVA